jgi:hypothetical protein
MSSHLNLVQAEEGTWRRKAILKSEDLARKLQQEWLEQEEGGALEVVLMQSNQPGKTWL